MPGREGGRVRLSITTLITTIVVLVVAVLLSPHIVARSSSVSQVLKRALGSASATHSGGHAGRKYHHHLTSDLTAGTSTKNLNMTRTPVYFISHGGPTTMYEKDHPVYPQLQAIGREITTKIKPKAIVVFSAHWQAQAANTIEVNVSEDEPLLYDYYGFPKHYYHQTVSYRTSSKLAHQVIEVLREGGIKTEEAERGFDHGVFVPFIVMFAEDTNPIKVPIVQVSLFEDDTDAEAHIRLGRAVEKLRDENILIIASGMSVHNLRHFGMLKMTNGGTMPYAVSFDAALKEAVETAPGEDRDRKMVGLLKRPDARQAHPTFEHLLPIHIGVGAAGQDPGKQLWTLPEFSMAWAQYRFGDVSA